jgi:hypothetical protein
VGFSFFSPISRDGNEEFPVGFWLLIPVPAGCGDPHELLRGGISSPSPSLFPAGINSRRGSPFSA